MVARTDVTVDFNVNPRLAEIDPAGSGEITAQDSHDTLVVIQDGREGGQFPDLVSTAGKEELGPGQAVGLTQSLKDVQYAPAPTDPRTTGTVTTADLNGVLLNDTGKDFVALGVQRGDWVINFDDRSVTEVLTVSTTQIKTRGLRNGTANTFGLNDNYKIWEVDEFSMSGGNFVAKDANDITIRPFFTTFGRYSTLTSASSATLAELQDIQFASFNGGITVDIANTTGNATSGTIYPAGTERQPSDNWNDALSIASDRGFNRFYVRNGATIGTAQDFTDFIFIGQGPNISSFTLPDSPNFTNATFEQATITGTLDGDSSIRNCVIENLNFVSGIITESILNPGTITLGGGQVAHFIDCDSGVPGVSTPIIDCGGSGQPLAMRGYNGGIQLINKTGPESISLDINSGQIKLENTVTGGTVVCRGIAKLTDNSNGATIVDELLDAESINTMYNMMIDIEDGMDLDEMMRIFMSALAAKMTGPLPGSAGTVDIRNMADTKTRISTPVDSNGYRGNATYDATP